MPNIDPELITKAEVVEVKSSLYDDYNLRLVDLGGGPVFLTPDGQSIFGAHIRMDQAVRLASVVGSLIENRIESPLEAPVIVIDFGGREELNEDQSWIAKQAVWRVPNFVGDPDVFMVDLEKHSVTDEQGNEVTIREKALPEGGYVSTYLGRSSCRVMLTPESVIPEK